MRISDWSSDVCSSDLLCARIDIYDRAQEHADLADPVEGPGADRGQAHHQVDHEEWEHQHQAQREQVEGAVSPDPFVEGTQPVSKEIGRATCRERVCRYV